MRISLVHSFYSADQVSGENVVVERQRDALVRAGHEVQVVARHTDDLAARRGYRARVSFTTATGRGPSPLGELRKFEPEVVHVHNLFPNFGTSWCADWDGALVATLHNFRTICSNGTLTRDGHNCTECPAGSPLAAVRHRCYRGSALATVPLAIASRRSPNQHPLLRRAERLIVLSQFVADTYSGLGVPREKLVLLPNFVPANFISAHPLAADTVHSRWLLAGRLSPEKGSVALLAAWPPDVPLDVVGSGPDEERARSIAPSSVRFLGSVDSSTLSEMMRSAAGLVFPSTWREHSPLIYLEALMAGLPVVALRGSSPAEDVESHGLGRVVDSLDTAELREATEAVMTARRSLGQRCRESFERRFSEDRWVENLLCVYTSVLAARGS